MKACIKFGIKDRVDVKEVDINNQANVIAVSFPDNGWEDFTKASFILENFQFSSGHIVSYFVNRSVSDGLPAGDFKAINRSAENLFVCGHVQSIQVCATDNNLFIKAKCLPEMRKDRVYLLRMVLNVKTFDIFFAECGCPAGLGPQGSCKHIGALSYALVDFSKMQSLPTHKSCTDKLQEWNKPRGKRVDPIPVEQLGSRRRELQGEKSRATGSKMVFDPRPLKFQTSSQQNLEELRCNLLMLEKPPAFLNILLPSLEKINHDHCYCQKGNDISDSSNNEMSVIANEPIQSSSMDCIFIEPTISPEKTILETLVLTAEERDTLELTTRKQSDCDTWHGARRLRITGSKCGRILLQKQKTTALLQFCLYPKAMIHQPKPIAWGKNNEVKARQEYVKHMEENGHRGIKTTLAGFVVHPHKCWLGASPDAWVSDPSVRDKQGIAEFKCLYSKAFVHPEEACKDADFYCSITNGKLHLKNTHAYYHQVQLQLYVSCNYAKWCDFCVYTTCGIATERIYPDPEWEGTYCTELDDYYMGSILPELISPEHKPSYYL